MQEDILMDKKTVEGMLQNADRKVLIDMISKMSELSHDTEKVIIQWCKKNNKSYRNKAIEIELKNLWEDARAVISIFNEYGGGPEDDEEAACDNLWKMDEIVKTHDIAWEFRSMILDEMLEEFNVGNSGFEDILIDVAASFCQNAQEQRYLADKLANGGSGYYRDYAARIYQSMGDQEQFLKIKLNNLRYGSDYVDVARYYAKAGDRAKELEYIWKGLRNSSGRLDGLVDYIAPIYIREEDDKELERLYKFIIKTKWDVNIAAIAKQLYDYSCKKGDYASKKKMLLLILDTCDKSELKKWFGACEKELQEEDWKEEYENILEKIKKRDQKFYLDICMETGREEIVLKCLQKSGCRCDYWGIDYDQYFSSRLVAKYPNEILDLYWKEVESLLRVSNNRDYETAVSFLKKIKALMKKNKKQEEWEEKINALKETHKRKKNFIALTGKL